MRRCNINNEKRVSDVIDAIGCGCVGCGGGDGDGSGGGGGGGGVSEMMGM